MKKLLFIIIIISISFFSAFSQEYVKTVQVFNKKSKFEFTNEWQYVSTDLYMINANKFNYLINIVNPTKRRTWLHRRNKEQIRNILVTAQLEGLGDLDKLTYPLFNFIVKKDEKGQYQIQTTEPEVIRIVDNVPVSSINDYLGAKIQVHIFSDKNRPEIYKFISTQLDIAASFASVSTTGAALKVVGEIGKLMKNDAAGKQYEFASTIRFYEEQNFDRYIHSIAIYVLEPSYFYSTGFDTLQLATYFDTLHSSALSKEQIKKLAHYTMFPYIVAINYRSKYKPQISDDVNFQMLKMRDAKNEENYKNKVISREIYLQEKNLIDFLNVYAQLQLDINNYELNYKAKITEDYTIELFMILQDYWKLKNTFSITVKANKGNPLFENEFKPLYNRYLTKVNLKFEGNSSLRAIREHVETIYTLEKNRSIKPDSAQTEDFLRKLEAVKMPPREYNSDEATITRHWINSLENDLYKNYFLPKINEFSNMPVVSKTNEEIEKFRLSSSNSYCGLCKINTETFVKKFLKDYNEYLFDIAQQKLSRTLAQTRTNIFKYSKKQSCIEKNIDSLYGQKDLPEHVILFKSTLAQISKQRENLYSLVNKDENFVNAYEINAYLTKIKDLKYQIETNFNSICNTDQNLCRCVNFSDIKNKANESKNK